MGMPPRQSDCVHSELAKAPTYHDKWYQNNMGPSFELRRLELLPETPWVEDATHSVSRGPGKDKRQLYNLASTVGYPNISRHSFVIFLFFLFLLFISAHGVRFDWRRAFCHPRGHDTRQAGHGLGCHPAIGCMAISQVVREAHET